MFSKFLRSILATLAMTFLGLNLAQATEMRFQPVPNGVQVTLIGVDAPDGPPPAGALHCITGTKRNYALSPDGGTAYLNRMIGGCVVATGGTVVHVIHHRAVNSEYVLCLIPIWADGRGRFLAWSSHPGGPTNHTARRGGMITALTLLPDGSWRAATAAEAYTCD